MNMITMLMACMLPVSTVHQGQVPRSPSNSEPNAIGLVRHISLDCTQVTLSEVANRLASQTGMRVSVADYLASRRVSVYARGVTAASAISAIAELNGLAFREDGPGEVLIYRKTLTPSSNLGDVSAAIRSVIPKDVNSRNGVGVPSKEYVKGREGWTGREWAAKLTNVEDIAAAHLDELITSQQKLLYYALKATLKPTTKIPLTEVGADVRRGIATVVLLQTLRASHYRFLYGALARYESEPESSVVELDKDGSLMFGTHWTDGASSKYQGFGASLSFKPIPVPKGQ